MTKIRPYLYFLAAAALGLLAFISFISMVQALTVRDTLSAIESAIGTGVLTLMLAVFAHKLVKTGMEKLHTNL